MYNLADFVKTFYTYASKLAVFIPYIHSLRLPFPFYSSEDKGESSKNIDTPFDFLFVCLIVFYLI